MRLAAVQLTRHLPQKDWLGEVNALFDFVQGHIRYIRDIRNVETLQTPEKTLQLKAGDCDDKSTLLAALLESIGHPARFHAVGFAPGKFSHVFVETLVGGKWMPLETTEPYDAGRAPSGAVMHMIRHL